MTTLLPVDIAVRDFRPGPVTDEEGAALFRAAVSLFSADMAAVSQP